MKKKSLLVLAAMATLTLVGCNGGSNPGSLPSGGKEVDLTQEEGATVLKERLNATAKAYAGLSYDSLQVVSTTSGVNLGLDVAAVASGMNMKANVNLKGFGAKAELNVAKSSEGSLDASLVAKTTGGSLSVKGELPDAEQKAVKISSDLSLKGAEVDAYISGSNVYVNAENSGNLALVKGVDKFANKLLDDLKKTVFGLLIEPYLSDLPVIKEGAFDITSFYSEANKKVKLPMEEAIAWPISGEVPEGEIEGLDQAVEAIKGVAAQGIGLSFKTYNDNGYGFALGMDKAALLKLVGDDGAETVNKLVNKLSVSVSAYFNKQFLLESVGFSFELAMKAESLADFGGDAAEVAGAFESFNASLTAKAQEELKINYGKGKVSFPSFEGYQEAAQ